MITVTFRNGMTRTYTDAFAPGTTINQALAANNGRVRLALGLPENVVALIDGEQVSMDFILDTDTSINFEVQAAKKAA